MIKVIELGVRKVDLTPALLMKCLALLEFMKKDGITPAHLLLVEEFEKDGKEEKKSPISDIQPGDLEKAINQNEPCNCFFYEKGKKIGEKIKKEKEHGL